MGERHAPDDPHPLVGRRGRLRCGRSDGQTLLRERAEHRAGERAGEVHAQAEPELEHVPHGDRAVGGDGVVDRAVGGPQHAAVGQLRQQRVDGVVQAQQPVVDQPVASVATTGLVTDEMRKIESDALMPAAPLDTSPARSTSHAAPCTSPDSTLASTALRTSMRPPCREGLTARTATRGQSNRSSRKLRFFFFL